MDTSLVIPAFIAGVLTFLAPCTLPLVPGYLGFISGVSSEDLKKNGAGRLRMRVFLNGLLYVVGFSAVFILLGSIFGLGGSLLASYRDVLARVSGIFVIVFGLFMMGALRFSFLNFLDGEKRFSPIGYIKPGNPGSSLLFGAAFAFGWTPCVGPVLGTVLTLAATSGTAFQGSVLLAVFALGLAVPFLVIAAGVGSASRYLQHLTPYLNAISFIGGIFLVFLGILLATNNFGFWVSYAYQLFDFIRYETLLEYL